MSRYTAAQMVDEHRVAMHAELWTSGRARYALVQVDPEQPESFAILDLEACAPVVNDDEPEVLARIKENMRMAGVRQLTLEEGRAIARSGGTTA
jgi:hypothetical protein